MALKGRMVGHPQLIDLVQDRMSAEPSAKSAEQLLAELVGGADDPVQAALDANEFGEFDLDYDPDEKILFCYFDYAARPCFTEAVLNDARAVQRMARGLFGERAEADSPLRYLVLGSRQPG